MAISSEGIKTKKTSMEALLSLEEEILVETLTRSPYLCEFKEVSERLKEISRAWKRRFELKKSRESSWENILYLVHLFPRSLDLPEFGWLKEKYINVLMRRQWDSNSDKSYWQALEKVRKDFNPTKPKTPEKKFMVARKFEYYRNLWTNKEISKVCKELLEIHNYAERDEDFVKVPFLRKIKIPQSIMDRELERLNKICSEEIKGEGDYIILPMLIQNELNLLEDRQEREKRQEFWMKIWKPIARKVKRLRPTFIMEVAKETGLSGETVRKLLKQANKEIGG
jgi:hypothetical protein